MKLKKIKKKLSKFLPQKIDNVLEKYDDFSNQDILFDAKSFNAHHGACKTAISHIHSLLKLAEETEVNEQANSITPAFDIEAILKEANDNFNEDD